MICCRKTSTPASTVCVPHALNQGCLLLRQTAEKRKSTSFSYKLVGTLKMIGGFLVLILELDLCNVISSRKTILGNIT